jgi:membrane-associated phospholipid phosphatase
MITKILTTIEQLDITISSKIHGLRLGSWEALIIPFGAMFTPGGIWVPILLMFPISYFDQSNPEREPEPTKGINQRAAIGCAFMIFYLMMILSLLIYNQIMKIFLMRRRPTITTQRKHFNLRKLESNNAMPSGDTAQSALWAGFIWIHFNYPPIFLFIIPLVAFARVYYMCHWIGDTMIGALFGLSFALVSQITAPMFGDLITVMSTQ